MKWAMVVVVEADNEDEAWESVPDVQLFEFVGTPWPVTDHSESMDFDTDTVIRERTKGTTDG